MTLPPKHSNTLTEAELRLMRLLWARGESAIADLVQALPDDTPLAYTTVLTTVRILEKKGYLRHRQVGRAFFYTPCVAEREARQSEIRHVLQRFFGNSRERLVLSLLGDSDATPEELERMKKAIANAPDEGDRPGDAPEET
jgi:predicted transcriptional regulator